MTQSNESSPSIPRKRNVPMWAQILIWVGLLAFLGILAVGLFKAQVPMIRVGAEVPNFTIPLYEGYEFNDKEQINFSDLHGKVVMINFWASWCVPCEEEAALLESAWQQYKGDGNVVFLGIDYVDTPTNGMDYLKEFNITYPNGPDLQESISPLFNRNMGVPETYFIDRNGILRYIQIGPFTSLNQIFGIIDPLVTEN